MRQITFVFALLLCACGEQELTVTERAELVCDTFQTCINETMSEGGTQWCRASVEANPVTTECALAIAAFDCTELLDHLPPECDR